MQNLLYALIQSIHNIGAVVIVGVGAYGLFLAPDRYKTTLAVIQSITWSLQGLSGGIFGLTTLYFYHQLPDIHGVAIWALMVKIVCVILGCCIATSYALWNEYFSSKVKKLCWILMFSLGNIALSSAAFLRWFS
jgi:hypothetical protein